MSKLYIPLKELSSWLYADESKNVLYSRTHMDPSFGAFDAKTVYPDQFWKLIRGVGDYDGYYKFKSDQTGHYLFSGTQEPTVGTHKDEYADQWFKFEQGSGKKNTSFHLINHAGNRVITVKDGKVGNYSTSGNVYDDQFFHFDFQDVEIISISYDIDRGSILASQPSFIGEQTQVNDSDIPQSMSFTFKKTHVVTYSFEYSLGFTITIGATAKVGIPFVAESQISAEVSNEHRLTWGESTSEELGIDVNFPVTSRPHSTVTCTATATESTFEVPFTIQSKSTTAGIVVETDGVYHGVSYWGVTSVIREVEKSPLISKPK